jgi:phospho-N-acetylmuramoyl-pentapeptide-transferase
MCSPDRFASHYELWGIHYAGNIWPLFIWLLVVGSLVALAVIPALINAQRAAALGQQVYESGPAAHLAKQGTPTMGGVAFVAAAVAATAYIAAVNNGFFGATTLEVVIAAACIGFADDFLKVRRRTPLGLRARTKMLLLTIIAVILAINFHVSGDTDCLGGMMLGANQWWFGHLIHLPDAGYYVLVVAAFVGCANAVNLTDGVDGLASSVALPPLLALSIIDTNAIGWAIAGAVIVFLFFNKHPAKIFMGDTGSLMLGGLLAFLALQTHLLLFLPLLGIVFVAEALSVIIQVVSFKLTGKRVFKMSPLHHHFELSGWSEQRITRTFALVSWLATAVFCAIVYFSNMRVAGGL